MGTRYLFEKAVKISNSLSPAEKASVLRLCQAIQTSQQDLIAMANVAMHHCLYRCRGICCKNLDIDSIFSLWDFIFILMLRPDLKDEMRNRLNAHTSLYLSPCPFLIDHTGPCIFPDGIKAQICVITFCTNDEDSKKPIQQVNLNFYRLCWQIQGLRVKSTARNLFKFVFGTDPRAGF